MYISLVLKCGLWKCHKCQHFIQIKEHKEVAGVNLWKKTKQIVHPGVDKKMKLILRCDKTKWNDIVSKVCEWKACMKYLLNVLKALTKVGLQLVFTKGQNCLW